MKTFLVLFLLAFVLSSCTKNKPPVGPEPTYYQLAAEGLSYIQLPLNSYYIYRDSATGMEDSVMVVASDLVKNFVQGSSGLFGGTPSYARQIFTLELKSKITNKTWFSGKAFASDSEMFNLNDNDFFWQYPVFTYPVTDRFIASMVVEGKSYADVEKYEVDYPSAIPDEYIVATYYWAKGVGIIKRQIKTASIQKSELLLRHGR